MLMQNTQLIVAIASVISSVIFAGVILLRWFQTRRRKRWRVAQAKRIIGRLRGFDDSNRAARQMAYLQKTDPFVFEELVLLLLKERGLLIRRNRRYTGDGGLDGRFRFAGKKWIFIQCKRYKGHIRRAHLYQFISLCVKHDTLGLFVHTGPVGKALHYASLDSPVELVGGARLLALLNGNSLTILGVALNPLKPLPGQTGFPSPAPP